MKAQIKRVVKKDGSQVWAIIKGDEALFEYDVRSVVSSALANNKDGSLKSIYKVVEGLSRSNRHVFREA